MFKMSELEPQKYAQNDVTRVKLFIMSVKSLLEVQDTTNITVNLDVTKYIILSDFQQYRTLLANVIQFFVSPEKCEN